MHLHRLMALAGVVIGVIGLALPSLSTDGEGLLPTLNEQSPDVPDGIPTIWGGLDTWAQWVLVALIIVVVVLAFMGDRSAPYDMTSAGVTAVIGVALLVYAIIKYVDAGDKAEDLEGVFAQFAGAGFPNVETWSVTPSPGFFVLMLGTVVVAAAGILSLISRNQSS